MSGGGGRLNDVVQTRRTSQRRSVHQRSRPYKHPREIGFIVDLSKTISGKTRRVELRERELLRVAEKLMERALRRPHEAKRRSEPG